MGPMTLPAGPPVEMVSNPNFSFPAQSQMSWSSPQNDTNDSMRRPASASMHIGIPQAQNATNPHRRTASTLPSFNFNADDASGLRDTKTPPRTPEDNAAATPSRHRRGGSEFVGGDSRLGVSNVVSSSPTKGINMFLPSSSAAPPTTKRGHAHRRSAAMSSHDVGSLMQAPTDFQPRLSSSLPTTPLEHPSQEASIDRPDSATHLNNGLPDPFGPPVESLLERPPSRARVGFADNVEYIPRPLSTISSETESSLSTLRGHSVNNSITSMLSLGTPSPPSSRAPRSSRSSTLEDESKQKTKSSLEISKRIEKEGEWLKSRPCGNITRPVSDSAMAPPKTTFTLPDARMRTSAHKRKLSFGHNLGFDRRRSEPTIGMHTSDMSRLSVISLQSSASDEHNPPQTQIERKSSTRKIKEWAAFKMLKRTKEPNKALATRSSTSSIRPESAGSASVPGKVSVTEAPVAETDLDAVFANQDTTSDCQRPSTPEQPRMEVGAATPVSHSDVQLRDMDDHAPMVDLDAALGPLQTPPMGSHRQRKELHSSRLTRDFNGPGGHYHRWSEGDSSLPHFQDGRGGVQQRSGMADVFEEDEEDSAGATKGSTLVGEGSKCVEDSGVGGQSIDMNTSGQRDLHDAGSEDGLGIKGTWEPERPSTSHGPANPWLPYVSVEGKGSSIIEETIMEEPSLMEGVEIVEAHEEPRSSSLTKSSVSSETPTILVAPATILSIPDGPRSLRTPETSRTSAFSSPDFHGRQCSFDASDRATSASSIADNRTVSSCMTGEHSHEGLRMSVDDVPSLTSSRSSATNAYGSRPEFRISGSQVQAARTRSIDPDDAAEHRRKRGSIQSLSQLVGGPFGSKCKIPDDKFGSQTSVLSGTAKTTKKKDHRLKKLMFWKPKQDDSHTARIN